MADRHTIFAWTETHGQQYPGYVNISRDENGKHTVTVRSRGNAGRDTATVEIPPEALESLLCDLAEDLYRDDVGRLMAMPEAEVDAELRRLGIDPAEAERKGMAAVEGALSVLSRAKAMYAEHPTYRGKTPLTWYEAPQKARRWWLDKAKAGLPDGVAAAPALRMLRPHELFEMSLHEPVRIADIEAVQRKFCEVNGLTLGVLASENTSPEKRDAQA
jgi:hypothetical protein